MSDALNRRFAWILGFSLLLHGLLFAGLSMPGEVRPVAPLRLLATLRQAITPKSSPSARAAVEIPARRVSAAVPPKLRPAPSVAAYSLAPRPTRAAEPTFASAAPVAASAPTSADAAMVSVAAPAPVSAPESSPAKVQNELLAAYRQRLSALLAGQQEYPRVAALRGWQGEVLLRLRVARKGNLLGVELDHSSGFAVLDQHALSMVEALAGLPPLPDALQANEIQVVVPINYKLKKST